MINDSKLIIKVEKRKQLVKRIMKYYQGDHIDGFKTNKLYYQIIQIVNILAHFPSERLPKKYLLYFDSFGF